MAARSDLRNLETLAHDSGRPLVDLREHGPGRGAGGVGITGIRAGGGSRIG